MRIAYLDCFSGISGDMFLGALLEAGLPARVLEETVAALNVGARLEISRVTRSGISATKVDVWIGDEKDLPREQVSHAHQHEHAHQHSSAGVSHPRTPKSGLLGTPVSAAVTRASPPRIGPAGRRRYLAGLTLGVHCPAQWQRSTASWPGWSRRKPTFPAGMPRRFCACWPRSAGASSAIPNP